MCAGMRGRPVCGVSVCISYMDIDTHFKTDFNKHFLKEETILQSSPCPLPTFPTVPSSPTHLLAGDLFLSFFT